MLQNAELRQLALQSLKGKWEQPVFLTLAFTLTCTFMIGVANAFVIYNENLSFIAILITILFTLPMEFSLLLCFLRFDRGEESLVVHLFDIFQKDWYRRGLSVTALTYLYTFLWSLLLIIPGIIKSYSYGMTYLIAMDHPELSAEECILQSMDMMEGKKAKLFLLDLSFIGWGLLCILTLGIGFLWYIPYYNMARIKFYEDLKAEYTPMEATKMG